MTVFIFIICIGAALFVAEQAGLNQKALLIETDSDFYDAIMTKGASRAYLKGGSPTCDKEGVTGELLRRNGVQVIRVG